MRAGVDIFALDYDAIIAAMYALTVSAEGDCYLCVPPDPGIEPAALGTSESALSGMVPPVLAPSSAVPAVCESALSGTAPTETALSGTAPAEACHTFTLDSVLAQSTTVLPCPAVPSGSLSGFHLPSFSTNLVSNAVIQDQWVDTFTPGGQRVAICTCSRTGRHLATFTRRPGSSLYTLTTASPQVAAVGQVSASGLVAHASRVRGQGGERYFLLVVDDYSRYTTVFPLRTKGEVPAVLIPWIRTVRLQLRRRFRTDLPVLRLHSDRGGEFSSDLLRTFCQAEGIEQTFTLPDSPQQNGVAERRIGLVMEVARTSLVHAAAPHFLWPFAVRYAAHQLNLWPRVSLPETSPTLRWTGEVGDASRFRVWGARALVRDTSADKLSSRTLPCVFLGFVPDAPGWQFYHPTSRRVFASQDVTFDESVPFYRLFPYRTAPLPPPPLFLAPGPPPAAPKQSFLSAIYPPILHSRNLLATPSARRVFSLMDGLSVVHLARPILGLVGLGFHVVIEWLEHAPAGIIDLLEPSRDKATRRYPNYFKPYSPRTASCSQHLPAFDPAAAAGAVAGAVQSATATLASTIAQAPGGLLFNGASALRLALREEGGNCNTRGGEWDEEQPSMSLVPHSHSDPGWLLTVEQSPSLAHHSPSCSQVLALCSLFRFLSFLRATTVRHTDKNDLGWLFSRVDDFKPEQVVLYSTL
ncbi:unnamed protein product [Closterium sp. Yama58-4]|nr:unnamed protein product [Closterium sp. Yama58-4]